MPRNVLFDSVVVIRKKNNKVEYKRNKMTSKVFEVEKRIFKHKRFNNLEAILKFPEKKNILINFSKEKFQNKNKEKT